MQQVSESARSTQDSESTPHVRLFGASWRRALAGALTLLAASVLTPSCGDSDDDGSSAATNPFDTCFLEGNQCGLRCSDSFGCVECLDNTDCGGGKPPACVLGKCEDCATDADCGAGKACFPKNFKCENKCAVDGDCPGDAPVCLIMTGACVGCVADVDCAGDKGHPICEPIHGQCSECSSSSHCGLAEPVCDLQAGECRDCLVDSDCPGLALCKADHKCHATCNLNGDCKDANKPICDALGSKECVACLVGTDCPNSLFPICDDHRCVGCAIDTDCPTTFPACKDGTCLECDGDQYCEDPAFPKCKGHMCEAG